MLKNKIGTLFSIVICSTAIGGWAANDRIVFADAVRSRSEIASQSKRELAKELVTKIGIDLKYDLYIGNNSDLTLPAAYDRKFKQWLQKSIASKAGWKTIESQYISRLEADLSESELRELLQVSQHPAMQKLLQTEVRAYSDTAETRHKLLSKFWDDYNSWKITPPPDVRR
jgi:citrate lyase synthetase